MGSPSSAQGLASRKLFLIGLSDKEVGLIQNLIGELSIGIQVVPLSAWPKEALDEGLALEMKTGAILVPSVLLRKQADLFEHILKIQPYVGVLVGEDPLEIELGRFVKRVHRTIQRPITAEKLLNLFEEIKPTEQKKPRISDVPQEGPRHFPLSPSSLKEGDLADSVEILRSVYESLDAERAYERSLKALIDTSQAKAGAMLERSNEQERWQVRSLLAIRPQDLEPYLKVLDALGPDGLKEPTLDQRIQGASFPYASTYPVPLMDERLAMALLLSDSPLGPGIAWVYTDVLRALKNASLFGSIQEKSYADPLTGVFNRRFLEIELPRELFRAKRHQRRVSILLVEIDSIGEISKKYGEDAVLSILKEAACRLSPNQGCIRNVDLLVKYGPLSFVIVLIESDYQNTLKVVAPRVLRVIREKPFLGKVSLTASIGIANFPVTSWDWRFLLSAAERALKEAQRAGGNTVVLANEGMI